MAEQPLLLGFRGSAGRRRGRRRKPKRKTLTQRVRRLEKTTSGNMVAHDTDVDDADVFATPLVGKISTIVGDAGEGWVRSLYIKGVIDLVADSTDTELVRIAIVLDKHNSDPDNDTPTWLNVFKENEIFSHRAVLDETKLPDKRYSIVSDKVYKVSRDQDGSMNNRLYWTVFKRYKDMHTIMDGTSSTSLKNGFYIMMMSTTVTTEIDVSYSARVTYIEDA